MKTQMPTQAEASIPDYKRANNEAKTLLDSLEIVTTCTPPRAEVQDNWPHIAYNLTFSKGGKSISMEYRLGIGHVNWKQAGGMFPRELEAVFVTLKHNPGARLKNKLEHAQAAAFLAQRQKVQPAAHEVLACYCSEALEASQNTFEDWADNLGYEKDSRTAEQTYHHCREPYAKIIGLIGLDNLRKFAELNNQF